jgi:hypothetical protein
MPLKPLRSHTSSTVQMHSLRVLLLVTVAMMIMVAALPTGCLSKVLIYSGSSGTVSRTYKLSVTYFQPTVGFRSQVLSRGVTGAADKEMTSICLASSPTSSMKIKVVTSATGISLRRISYTDTTCGAGGVDLGLVSSDDFEVEFYEETGFSWCSMHIKRLSS